MCTLSLHKVTHDSPATLTAPVSPCGRSAVCDTCVLLPESLNVCQKIVDFLNCPGKNSGLVKSALDVSVLGIAIKNNEDVLLVWLRDNISLAVILHN